MSNQKQFGVWMDTQHAIIVGNENSDSDKFVILGRVNGEEISRMTSEKSFDNHQKTVLAKFFKEISSHMLNATHVHVTGTGQVQEQFIHYLAETPQFKNTRTEESTANKMGDDSLVAFIGSKLK